MEGGLLFLSIGDFLTASVVEQSKRYGTKPWALFLFLRDFLSPLFLSLVKSGSGMGKVGEGKILTAKTPMTAPTVLPASLSNSLHSGAHPAPKNFSYGVT